MTRRVDSGYICSIFLLFYVTYLSGWSGDAMVLGKLPVPGRPANLDYSRARASATAVSAEVFGHFFSHLSFLFFLPLSGRRPDMDGWMTCDLKSFLTIF